MDAWTRAPATVTKTKMPTRIARRSVHEVARATPTPAATDASPTARNPGVSGASARARAMSSGLALPTPRSVSETASGMAAPKTAMTRPRTTKPVTRIATATVWARGPTVTRKGWVLFTYGSFVSPAGPDGGASRQLADAHERTDQARQNRPS